MLYRGGLLYKLHDLCIICGKIAALVEISFSSDSEIKYNLPVTLKTWHRKKRQKNPWKDCCEVVLQQLKSWCVDLLTGLDLY